MTALIKYIENNLSLDLDIELLSRLGFVSHTQLYRDFYSVTGHPIKEYIRKRRLSNALALIKTSELSLSDIAYEYGYSSQQTLCRVVKNAVHMTPIEYKNSDVYYFFPSFNGNTKNQITVSTEMIPQTLCLKFYQHGLKGIENNAVGYLLSLGSDFKGRIFGRNGKQKGTSFCYELFISDFDNIIQILKLSRFEIIHQKPAYAAVFASTTVRNIDEKINSAWNYLYKSWLSLSMFESTGEQYFEEYILNDCKPVKLRLYLPIQKRNDYNKITLEKIQPMRFLVSKAKGLNAEQITSQSVVDYLSKNYAHIIRTSKEFYIQEGINTFTCGIRVNVEIPVPEEKNIQNLCPDEGLYAVLHSNVMGDYCHYRDMLISWLHDNGMTADENSVFAVYDAKESFDNPKIRIYCPIKIGTK